MKLSVTRLLLWLSSACLVAALVQSPDAARFTSPTSAGRPSNPAPAEAKPSIPRLASTARQRRCVRPREVKPRLC
jgi:hypothetical protein